MNLFEFLQVPLVLFTLFVAPLWILFNYLGKSKVAARLTREDEKILEDLWKTAKKMEDRVINLETIYKNVKK
ncbi:MAG: envelope stress response membrane protein PspB [Bacteriovoracaceae bacterium]|nr:envelope stress response membrane protein PspB [Bacteriovoracaceae bacterium]